MKRFGFNDLQIHACLVSFSRRMAICHEKLTCLSMDCHKAKLTSDAEEIQRSFSGQGSLNHDMDLSLQSSFY